MNIDEAVSAYNAGELPNPAEVFKPLAEQGNMVAQNLLGEIYRDGEGVEENPAESVKWFRKSAEQGDAEAQFNLGSMYLDDEGVKRNPSEAMKWFHKAAKQGHAMAQLNLGEMHLEKKNTAEGVLWMRKAAEGFPDFLNINLSAIRLAEIYRTGDGVNKDIREAVRWYKKEFEHGDESAAYEIARIYFEGQEIKQDYSEAAKWFQKAAELLYKDSCFQLGQMYLKGLGVRKSDLEAAMWFCKGAKTDPDCKTAFVELSKKGIPISEDEREFAKLKQEAIEDFQINLGLKKKRFHHFINRLTIYIFFGLSTLVFLGWYDWNMLVTHFLEPTHPVGWLRLFIVIFNGLYIGGWLSDITYKCLASAESGPKVVQS